MATSLHMGCNQEIAYRAIQMTPGMTLIEQMHAGLKLETSSNLAWGQYLNTYYGLLREYHETQLIQEIDASCLRQEERRG